MKVVKKRIREHIRASGLQTFIVRSTSMQFLPSWLLSSSSLLLLLFLLLIQSSDAEETEGSLADQGAQATTPLPCTEVSIDALWMRLDFHNGRTAELEKDLVDSDSDSVVASSNHKGSKMRRQNQNKQQSSLKSGNSSSELSPQQTRNTRPTKPRRHSTVRPPRRYHSKSKKSSTSSPTTTTATTMTATPEQTSTSKRSKQDKRKRSSNRHLAKRNSEPIDDQVPWLCQMTSYWQMLDEDTIPRYVKTGNCSTNASCYQGSYDCAPKKYIIKVLKRLKNVCYPVPTTDTTKGLFEEAWVFVDMEVTVACECSNVRQPGIYKTVNNSG